MVPGDFSKHPLIWIRFEIANKIILFGNVDAYCSEQIVVLP